CASRSARPAVTPTNWSIVRSLSPGTTARIVFRWGTSVRGTIVAVEEERIRISQRRTEHEYKRADVVKIFRLSGRTTAKRSKIGSLVGLTAGALVIASEGRVTSFGLLLNRKILTTSARLYSCSVRLWLIRIRS